MPTRKDFQKMADVIGKLSDANLRKQIAEAIADEYAKQNPRFDRKRFLAACNV